MDRDAPLPHGSRDLAQKVGLIGKDGTDLGQMTLYQATQIAEREGGKLVGVTPTHAKLPIFMVMAD
jgi:translation initiation factor IF-3